MVMVYIIYLDICFEPTEVHNTEASSYDQWLPTWLDHLISGSHPGTIPTEACHIQTPLNKAAWQHYLQDYLYQDLSTLLNTSVQSDLFGGTSSCSHGMVTASCVTLLS